MLTLSYQTNLSFILLFELTLAETYHYLSAQDFQIPLKASSELSKHTSRSIKSVNMDSNQPMFGTAAAPTGSSSGVDTKAPLTGADGQECATGNPAVAEAAVAPTDDKSAAFNCQTQSTPDTSSGEVEPIFVGFNNECPRFKPSTVIKYISYFSGWPGGQGQLISDTMWAAASEWNRQNIGVTFQWTTNRAEATFEVVYGGANDNFVAKAFFPNETTRQVLVYSASFTPPGLVRMQNSFQHELGHVMGLRHEFADKEIPGAILVGARNDLSIMSYAQNRSIQSTDVKWTRYFYALPNGTSISDGTKSYPIKDYV